MVVVVAAVVSAVLVLVVIVASESVLVSAEGCDTRSAVDMSGAVSAVSFVRSLRSCLMPM